MMKKIIFKLYHTIAIPIDIFKVFQFFPFLFKNKIKVKKFSSNRELNMLQEIS
jgi:hypothetical protein